MTDANQAFMKAYTVKEVSKLLEISPGTIICESHVMIAANGFILTLK